MSQLYTSPGLHIVVASGKAFSEQAYRVNHEIGTEFCVRVVRGQKMRTRIDCFDEVSAALQFPDYFGENWDAFEECLQDLDWLHAKGYVLFAPHATEILCGENDQEFQTFVHILAEASHKWAAASSPKTFSVFFQCDREKLIAFRSRFQSATAEVIVSTL